MKSTRLRTWAALTLTLAVALAASAITTVEVDVVCPVCQTKNKFYDYASWGSYVYRYPSKFQLVFWPYTSSATIYSCKKCYLSLYMWDFKNLPKDKVGDIGKLLEGEHLPAQYKTYTDIPASDKLLIAERIYQLLGKDDAFWSQFYRLLGYYLAREKKAAQAAEARQKALDITERMLADPANNGQKKELLVVAAAMHHFLGEDRAALDELRSASLEVFTDTKIGADRSKGYDEYLSSLIQEYIPAIENGQVPSGTE